jgi:hypothetical protein
MFESIKLKMKQWDQIIHAILYPGEPDDYIKWYDFALAQWRLHNGHGPETFSKWKKFTSNFYGPLHYPPRPTCGYDFLIELPQPEEGRYMHTVAVMLMEERDGTSRQFTAATRYEIHTAKVLLRLEAYYRTYCPDYVPEEVVDDAVSD